MSALPESLRIALALLAVTAAIWDIRTRSIPNWLVLAGLAAGVAGNVLLDGWRGAGSAFGGFGLALLLYLPLYLLRAAGGGDLKLAVAMGAIAGAVNWLVIFVLTAVLGGVFALLLVAVSGRLVRTVRNIAYILRQIARGRAPYQGRPDLDVRSPESLRLPHGVAMALGALGYLGASAMLAAR